MLQDNNQTRAEAHPELQDMPEPYIVEENAKNRCQHSKIVNQCRYSTVDHTEYCKYHVALYCPAFKKQNRLKKYKLVTHYSRVDELVSSTEVKSLREEVGILQLTLETIVNQCHTPWDLQINSSKIESLVEKIGKTMMLGHKLETQLGQVLDKQTLSVFVDEVIRIISDEVNEPDRLRRIGERIGGCIEKAQASAAQQAVFKDKTTQL